MVLFVNRVCMVGHSAARKAFVLVDLLFGFSLLLSVLFLCGYFQQAIMISAAHHKKYRHATLRYYQDCFDKELWQQDGEITLLAVQEGEIFWRREGLLASINEGEHTFVVAVDVA